MIQGKANLIIIVVSESINVGHMCHDEYGHLLDSHKHQGVREYDTDDGAQFEKEKTLD